MYVVKRQPGLGDVSPITWMAGVAVVAGLWALFLWRRG
jgi:hypothetical protein